MNQINKKDNNKMKESNNDNNYNEKEDLILKIKNLEN